MHSIAWTEKILTFMSLAGECRQQKHTQHAPSTKTKCDYLCGHVHKNLTPIGEPQRDSWEHRRRRSMCFCPVCISQVECLPTGDRKIFNGILLGCRGRGRDFAHIHLHLHIHIHTHTHMCILYLCPAQLNFSVIKVITAFCDY